MTGGVFFQRNGAVWRDVAGVPIQAHGGWVLPHDGAFWWYGEDKSAPTHDRRCDARGIRCYHSVDLLNWEDRGLVLTAAAAGVAPEGVLERPRVLLCVATGRFVMWLHVDDASYRRAETCVAVADAPDGPFVPVRAMRPAGQESRDLTVFVDADGRGWLVHSSESNQTLRVVPLTSSYEDVAGPGVRVLVDQARESPCVLAAEGQHYLVTSGCTGWRPNACLFATAPAMTGPWKLVDNPCRGKGAQTNYGGQATCAFEAAGRPYALLDLWRPDNLGSSGYAVLPVNALGDRHHALEIPWTNEWAGLS